MIIVLITIMVKSDYINQFKQLTKDNLKDRDQSGAIWTEFFQDTRSSEKFTIIEAFESQESIDDYYNSSSYSNWHKEVQNMIVTIQGSDQYLIHKS